MDKQTDDERGKHVEDPVSLADTVETGTHQPAASLIEEHGEKDDPAAKRQKKHLFLRILHSYKPEHIGGTGTVILCLLIVHALALGFLESLLASYHVDQASRCALNPTALGIAQTDLIYRGWMVAAPLYQVVLCIDALKSDNTVQLYSLIPFGLITVINAGIQVYQDTTRQQWMSNLGCEQNGTDSHYLYFIVLGISPLCFLILIALSTRIHTCFDRKRYPHTVSFATLLALIKFDLFFVASLFTQLVPSGLLHYNVTVLETVMLVTIGTLVFLLTWYALEHEIPTLLALLSAVTAISLGYFGFRIVSFAIFQGTESTDPYQMTRYSLLFNALVLLVLLILTVGVGVVCFHDTCCVERSYIK